MGIISTRFALRNAAIFIASTGALVACGGNSQNASTGTQLLAATTATTTASVTKTTLALQQTAGSQVYRAYFTDPKLARKIVHSRFDTLEANYDLGYFMVQADASDAAALIAMGFRLEVDAQWLQKREAEIVLDSQAWSADQQIKRKRAAGVTTAAALASTFVGIPKFPCYPTVEEVYKIGDDLIAAHPTLASWVTIGQSWEKTQNSAKGYDLKVLKITNSATNASAGVKPILFITAAMHPREYSVTPLALEFAQKLINGYGTDPDATWILDHHSVNILLQMNPDGRKQAEKGLSWRKNTDTKFCGNKPATADSDGVGTGVDLNRNFTFDWNVTGNSEASSSDQCSDIYHGPSAGSEPEVAAVEKYIKTLWADKRLPAHSAAAPLDTTGMYIDIHSYSQEMYWSWGEKKGDLSGNDKQLETLTKKLAYYPKYKAESLIDSGYPTDGTSDGAAYGELGVPSITFEIGKADFEKCTDYTNTILQPNLDSLMYAAKVVRAPYMTPSGPESINVTATTSGATTTLKAGIDDTRYSQLKKSTGVTVIQPSEPIAAAEYYVDTPPWAAGAVAVPMTAADGAFNATVEQVQATINTSSWNAGKHLVYVRGKDSAGNWGSVSAVFVTTTGGGVNTPPVAAFSQSVSGSAVTFTDNSTDDGTIVSRSWSFGDGSSGTTSPATHTYAASGTYVVTLTVTDNQGATNSTSHSVTVNPGTNQPPVAAFTSSVNGEAVTFTDQSTDDGAIASRSWNFGDGSSGSGTPATHNYAASGTYAVTLTVADNQGSSSSVSHSVTVSVSTNTPPVAAFASAVNGKVVSFTDQSTDDGTIVSRSWNFGDGNTGSGTTVSHTYAADGNYVVSLTVVDNNGASNSISNSVTVQSSGVEQLVNDQTVSGINLAKGVWRYFQLTVPAGARHLKIKTSGGTGNTDLYTQIGKKPTASDNNCDDTGNSNSGSCSESKPDAGIWTIGLFGTAASSGVSLNVTYSP